MGKIEWNWKTGLIVVVPCILACIVIDVINGRDLASIAINSTVAAVGSSFGVFLLWLWQKQRMKKSLSNSQFPIGERN